MVVEIDMERSENVRRWWPFLRDRRIDEYEGPVSYTHLDVYKRQAYRSSTTLSVGKNVKINRHSPL